MTQKLLVIIFCTVLSSCAARRVHLFTEAMSTEEISTLSQVLTDNNYEVLLNSLPIPEGMVCAAIIYSASHRKPKDIEALRDLLDRQGLSVDLEAVSQGNHFYTGENVGLYPKRYEPGRARHMTLAEKEFFGECPEVDATLSLFADLTFAAQFFVWDAAKQVETVSVEKGVWRQYREEITFAVGHAELLFSVHRISTNTDYAKIDGIKLVSAQPYEVMAGCEFVYREMDPH